MTLLSALLLGLIQGVTEFLPVSSTGHLVLGRWLLGIEGGGLSFDLALHAGTLGAVCLYFRRDLADVARAGLAFFKSPAPLRDPKQRLLFMLGVGTLPGGVAGLLFRKEIGTTLRSPAVVGVSLIAVAIAILAVERVCRPRRGLEEMGYGASIWVGICQAVALIPGVSRSGATIAGGLALGLRREEAVRFSFLLGIPVVLGAIVIEGREVLTHGLGSVSWQAYAVGILTAAVSGYACVAGLLWFVRARHFTSLMVYRILLGALVLYLTLGQGFNGS